MLFAGEISFDLLLLGWLLWTHGTFVGWKKWRCTVQRWSTPISTRTHVRQTVSFSRSQWSRGMFVFSYAWTWSLLISDASEDDAGEYTCRVSSDDRTLTIIKRFNFTVLSKHWFLSFTLICDPRPSIVSFLLSERCFRWLFDERNRKFWHDRITPVISLPFFMICWWEETKFLRLSFPSVNHRHTDVQAEPSFASRRIGLVIVILRMSFLAPPKIVDITIESNNHGVLIENEQVILKCIVRGIPQPKILWHLPGKKNSLSVNHRADRSETHARRTSSHSGYSHRLDLLTYENKLLIRNFSRTTPMNYQCIADNGIPPRDTRTRYLVPASKHMTAKGTLPSSLLSITLSRSLTRLSRDISVSPSNKRQRAMASSSSSHSRSPLNN